MNDIGSINEKLQKLQEALDSSKKATAPLESQVNSLKAQIADIEDRISYIENDIVQKRKYINNGYKDLAKQQDLLDKTVRHYYVNTYAFSPLILFISSKDASNLTRALAYQKREANKDKGIITNVAIKIADLEQKQKELEKEESGLEGAKAKIAVEKQGIEKIVLGAKQYQSTLSNQIAQLSARQQELVAQRLGSLNIPRSAGASALYCTDDRKTNPGFDSGFAFAPSSIPHYVGLNQYGAYGRAKANQDYKTILNAYFQNISIECRDVPSSIDVQGYGNMNFEDYIKGVVNKEMGADLPEALKAQAVVARSFAMNEAKPICTSQSCQVYSNDRRDAVNNAVDATGVNTCGSGKAEFVVSNGEIVKTWFASTFGGYSHTSQEIWGGATSYTKNFADTRSSSIGSFSDLNSQAYDNESPCFYTAQGWRKQYNNSAWLKPEEVADIVNVILLAEAVNNDKSITDHFYQTDKPHPYGGEIWNEERVKSELKSRGITPFNNISSISIGADFSSGRTSSVEVSGDAGNKPFVGSEFKDWFNLRAPDNLQIVGPLFNAEKR
ncbi:SpoIID/LytB domain-containing protein [Patescibacteria group bacterium]|nr:SpoIID/LytB domain-containing protein [Patescibacteria group bacterium]